MSQTLEQQIKSLDLKQNAIKILINSFYGAFGNRYFYFHNNDIAQSITLQGQDLIKFSIKAINHYFLNRWHLDTELHEKLGLSGYTITQIPKDAAIYTDTDSVYSCLEYAINSIEGLVLTDVEALTLCLAINKYRLREYFENAFEKYAKYFHTENRQNFELENLSRAGIWAAKKKYVLVVSYKDNKQEKLLDKEFLLIKGLEAIQASYPIWARKKLQEIYWILLNKGYDLNLETDLIPVLAAMKEEFMPLPIDDVASSFSVRVYEEHLHSLVPLVLEKGMPIYGRATAYHNHIIKKTDNQKYPLIRGGSKIRFYYAAPNEYDFDIFGYAPGLFPEFALPMDRDQQFFRLLVEPINKLIVAMGFSELTPGLTRRVDVIKSRSRTKVFTNEETYPLYAVNSETLDYSEIPEICQQYIGNPDIDVPPDVFPIFISAISKFGLSTVIVPKHEVQKYRERIAKKKGMTIDDPFAITYDEMKKVLEENGWEMSWDADNWVKSSAKNKEANTGITTKSAYGRVVKLLAKTAVVYTKDEIEQYIEPNA
jgi:hypothetical protein